MKTYQIAQQTPNSNNKGLTMSLQQQERAFKQSYYGSWCIMKDNKIYSTHIIQSSEDYDNMFNTYTSEYKRLGLHAIPVAV